MAYGRRTMLGQDFGFPDLGFFDSGGVPDVGLPDFGGVSDTGGGFSGELFGDSPGTTFSPAPSSGGGVVVSGVGSVLAGFGGIVRSLFPAGIFAPTGARYTVTPTGTTVAYPGGAAPGTPITSAAWFWPVVLGGGVLVLLMAVRKR